MVETVENDLDRGIEIFVADLYILFVETSFAFAEAGKDHTDAEVDHTQAEEDSRLVALTEGT